MGVEALQWHGVRRTYRRELDGEEAMRLASLVEAPLTLDPGGVLDAWGVTPAPERTILAGVRKVMVRAATTPGGVAPTALELSKLLEADLALMAKRAESPALLLGGGLDGALVLAAWRAAGLAMPTVYTLRTGFAEYDEVDAAQAIAASMQVPCVVLDIPPMAFVRMLPTAIAEAETPVYNLHPISRFLLARSIHARGHRTLFTGDGADAICAHQPHLDDVPLVARLTEASGLRLRSPFLEGRTFDRLKNGPVQEDKRALRACAEQLQLPKFLVEGKQQPRWMPRIDLSPLTDARKMEQVAAMLGMPMTAETDRDRVGWVTLTLLVDSFEGWL